MITNIHCTNCNKTTAHAEMIPEFMAGVAQLVSIHASRCTVCNHIDQRRIETHCLCDICKQRRGRLLRDKCPPSESQAQPTFNVEPGSVAYRLAEIEKWVNGTQQNLIDMAINATNSKSGIHNNAVDITKLGERIINLEHQIENDLGESIVPLSVRDPNYLINHLHSKPIETESNNWFFAVSLAMLAIICASGLFIVCLFKH